MKTTFNINTKIQVEVEVSEGNVFIRVTTDIDKRSYFYETISEAIQNTCIVPVQKYLLSI
jgi:hypothetical protein